MANEWTALDWIELWCCIAGGIWVLFEAAQGAVNAEVKKSVSQWLRNIGEVKSAAWPKTFAVLFDGVFGSKHFSWSFLARSAAASFASVLFMILVWWVVRPVQFYEFATHDQFINQILAGFVLFSVLNVIPDYLSLLESRWLISAMGLRLSGLWVALLIVADVVATAGIAFGAWLLISLPFAGWGLSMRYFVKRIS